MATSLTSNYKVANGSLIKYASPSDDVVRVAVYVVPDAIIIIIVHPITNIELNNGVSTDQVNQPPLIPHLPPQGPPPVETNDIVGVAPVTENESIDPDLVPSPSSSLICLNYLFHEPAAPKNHIPAHLMTIQ